MLIEGEGYLGVSAIFKGKLCYFVNVYSPCVLAQKRRSWGRMIELRGLWGNGEWCLGVF